MSSSIVDEERKMMMVVVLEGVEAVIKTMELLMVLHGETALVRNGDDV